MDFQRVKCDKTIPNFFFSTQKYKQTAENSIWKTDESTTYQPYNVYVV